MVIKSGGSLKGSWKRYQTQEIKRLCQSLTSQQKHKLRDKILARAFFFGVANAKAYKVALQNLN